MQVTETPHKFFIPIISTLQLTILLLSSSSSMKKNWLSYHRSPSVRKYTNSGTLICKLLSTKFTIWSLGTWSLASSTMTSMYISVRLVNYFFLQVSSLKEGTSLDAVAHSKNRSDFSWGKHYHPRALFNSHVVPWKIAIFAHVDLATFTWILTFCTPLTVRLKRDLDILHPDFPGGTGNTHCE